MKEGRPLSDFFDKELTGFVLSVCFTVEVRHGLMGCFPIINIETKEPIVFENKAAAKKAAEALPEHEPKFNKSLCLINKKENRAYDLGGIDFFVLERYMRQDLEFITEEKLANMDIKKELRWAPGIF